MIGITSRALTEGSTTKAAAGTDLRLETTTTVTSAKTTTATRVETTTSVATTIETREGTTALRSAEMTTETRAETTALIGVVMTTMTSVRSTFVTTAATISTYLTVATARVPLHHRLSLSLGIRATVTTETRCLKTLLLSRPIATEIENGLVVLSSISRASHSPTIRVTGDRRAGSQLSVRHPERALRWYLSTGKLT